ncbi:lytic transglycosylase domain-containing protein [Pseudomonas sp. NPDC089534]|uniref:lytic transglycosylase domain-containing protein n=1 Tax=Pseudomonas sp. NPDC089534 TaxID=3364468 RepID=UPI00382AF769
MPKTKPLVTAKKPLTPKADTASAKIVVDDSQRLREIRKLVEANNRSTIDTNTVICQIYMESHFDANAGLGKHSARGLMQMQKPAVQQVYKYRKKKELGRSPSDPQTQEAFKAGAEFYDSPAIWDEAQNIQIGTEYMQYWLDISSSTEEAYKKYRGIPNGVYYRKISDCAKKLAANPNSMDILRNTLK